MKNFLRNLLSLFDGSAPRPPVELIWVERLEHGKSKLFGYDPNTGQLLAEIHPILGGWKLYDNKRITYINPIYQTVEFAKNAVEGRS